MLRDRSESRYDYTDNYQWFSRAKYQTTGIQVLKEFLGLCHSPTRFPWHKMLQLAQDWGSPLSCGGICYKKEIKAAWIENPCILELLGCNKTPQITQQRIAAHWKMEAPNNLFGAHIHSGVFSHAIWKHKDCNQQKGQTFIDLRNAGGLGKSYDVI
jgi:hypothetical protein